MEDRVSVIIRTFRRREMLVRALESVLAQTRPVDEIIVVNDDDLPGLQAFLQACKIPLERVRLIEEGHGGRIVALNRGVQAAAGDWLIFLDDDDILEPAMVGESLARAREDDAALAVVASRAFDSTGTLRVEDIPAGSFEVLFNRLLWDNFIRMNAVLVRRRAVLDAGGFDEEMLYCEDWDLWMRLLARGERASFLRKQLAAYRQHPDRASIDEVKLQPYRLQLLLRLEKILDSRRRRDTGISRLITLRLLIYGWYLCLEKEFGKGRELFGQARRRGCFGWAASLFLHGLSFLPPAVLLRLTRIAEWIRLRFL